MFYHFRLISLYKCPILRCPIKFSPRFLLRRLGWINCLRQVQRQHLFTRARNMTYQENYVDKSLETWVFFFLIPYNVFLSEKNSLSQQMTIHLWFSSVLGYTLQFDIDHISFAQGYLKKFCINDLNHLQRLKIKHAAINVHYIHKTTRQSQLCVTKKRRKCSLPSVFIHYSYLYQWRLY